MPIYFKKALEELESEWSTHKKIIDIKREKGGLRKQIPKSNDHLLIEISIPLILLIDFPYFYVDFGTQFGYAHIIEKKDRFNVLFAHVMNHY